MESRHPHPASSFPGNDWHRRLFQSVPDSLLVTRARDGRIMDMNSRFLDTLGYTREELVGRNTLDLGFWIFPGDREALMTLLRDGRGVCSGFETAMRNRQGDEIPVLMSARVTEIDGESYVIKNLLKAMRGEKTGEMEYRVLKKDGSRFPDITDRVQAEEELKASEEKYRLVVENANEAIFIAQDGLLKLFNPKTVEIVGIDA